MMLARPMLDSPRLTMRPLAASDADALHPLFADAVAATYSAHPPHVSFDQTVRRLAQNLRARDQRGWAITLKGGDDRAIGTLVCWDRRQGDVIEIGYSLAREHWHRGLAGEAVSALLDRLFADGARRVFADTDPDNAASNALLERLGFTLEGRLRGEWETHIGIRDSLIWGLLQDEWRR